MTHEDTYLGKTQAIRACLAEHPDTVPARVVQILATRGIQVSPAHVVVVQTVVRSERSEHVAAAS